jgi:hypothetical protein
MTFFVTQAEFKSTARRGAIRRRRLGLLVSIACLIARPALAQFVDRSYPAAVANDFADQGLPLLNAPPQEIGTQGLHAGTFWITPELDSSNGYDSNASAQAKAGPSLFTRNQADITARSDWGRDSLYGYASLDDTRYAAEPQQDTTDATILGRGTVALDRGVATLLLSHLQLNETPRDLDLPTLRTPAPYSVDAARASYAEDLGPLTITPVMDYERWRYTNVSQQTLTYQDRDVLVGGMTGQYQVADGRRLLIVLRGVENLYVTPQPGVPSRNAVGIDALAGVEDQEGPLRLRILAGYQQRSFAAGAGKPLVGPIVEATAIWRPTGLTTVSGSLLHTIADSALPNVSVDTLTEAQLEIDHELRRDIILQAGVRSDAYAYPQDAGSATLYSSSLGATWLVNRHVRLGLSYAYARRNSAGSSFDESIVQLQLHLGL